MTEIGKLNKLVSIIATTKVSDGMGGYTETDSTIASNIWAAIWPTSSKELVALNSTTFEITHRIRIRFRSAFKASWRIKFGTRYFAIVSILNPEERNEWLDLLCREAA